ncbi:MAG: efflux RND transporter periplasmic adaptor subunit [Pseudohongiellaceae bacterium]
MKKQQLVAIALFVLVVAWMIVPRSNEQTNDELTGSNRSIQAISEGQTASENPEIITVRAIRVSPQSYNEQIRVRGRTQAIRMVDVRAEAAGRIVSEPVTRGARVNQGDTLCEIAVDNRSADLMEAESRLEQSQFEYDASVDLQARNLQSEVAVAQFKAALESAKAGVSRAKLALTNTKIRAPFDGVVEMRNVERGDLLNIGDVCASVLDDSPMLLVGLVPEQEIAAISLDSQVQAQLLTGEIISGKVTYIARNADAISRSYRIEAEVDSNNLDIRAGVTAEILVQAENLSAHLIPSSALTLDDNGAIGVKLIDDQGNVSFSNVNIVGDDTNQLNPGIWVTGLNGNINLVTIGQEIVFPGQQVDSNFEWSD